MGSGAAVGAAVGLSAERVTARNARVSKGRVRVFMVAISLL